MVADLQVLFLSISIISNEGALDLRNQYLLTFFQTLFLQMKMRNMKNPLSMLQKSMNLKRAWTDVSPSQGCL